MLLKRRNMAGPIGSMPIPQDVSLAQSRGDRRVARAWGLVPYAGLVALAAGLIVIGMSIIVAPLMAKVTSATRNLPAPQTGDNRSIPGSVRNAGRMQVDEPTEAEDCCAAISMGGRDGGALTASQLTDFTVRQKPIVELQGLLPVAIGVPALLGFSTGSACAIGCFRPDPHDMARNHRR